MARTLTEIKDGITANFVAEMAAIGITVDSSTWSITHLARIIIYVASLGIYMLEKIFAAHIAEVDEKLATLKPPTRQWIAGVIKNYQHGFPLISETDRFDNTGYTDVEVEASKVVKHVAVIRQVNVYGRVKLRLKIAGSNGIDLVQSSTAVVNGLSAYLDVALAAGDNWEVEGKPFDKIKMKWRIYYDPLILSATGSRLDGTDPEPVKNAIKEFFVSGIPFSGTYILAKHIDFIQSVQGVKVPEILDCSASYGNLPYQPITTYYVPDGGWIRFAQDIDLEIIYIANDAV